MFWIQHRVALLSAALPLALAISACNQPPAGQPAPAAPAVAPAQSKVDRGRMLVIGGGCNDCHTTKKMGPKGPEPDMSKMLSGHPESIKVAAPYKPARGSQRRSATTNWPCSTCRSGATWRRVCS